MAKTKLKNKEKEVLAEHLNFRISASEAAVIDRQAKRYGKTRSQILRGLISNIKG